MCTNWKKVIEKIFAGLISDTSPEYVEVTSMSDSQISRVYCVKKYIQLHFMLITSIFTRLTKHCELDIAVIIVI